MSFFFINLDGISSD